MSDCEWEYTIEFVHLVGNDMGNVLNAAVVTLDALGRDGWEAVGFSPSHASSRGSRFEATEHAVLLKRPKRA